MTLRRIALCAVVLLAGCGPIKTQSEYYADTCRTRLTWARTWEDSARVATRDTLYVAIGGDPIKCDHFLARSGR